MYYFKSVMQWVLTVVIGSLTVSFIESKYFNEFVTTTNQLIDSTFSMAGISIVVSAVFSLPALIILLFIRHRNKLNELNYPVSRNRVLITHALVSFVTFTVIFLIDIYSGKNLDQFIILCGVTYPAIGHIIWYIGERTETQRIEPSLIR